jgi:uncharacterized protein YqhQ
LNLFIEYQSTKLIISYVLAYEVFDLENSDRIPIVNILFKIGNLFQEHVVTSEPTDFQLAVSIETMGKLIELDTAQQVGSDIA